MIDLTEEFWTNKYTKNKTGWDLGQISPPLKMYFDQLIDKSKNILIPGAGNAYEAAYLFEKGFQNISILDIAEAPLKNFKERVPSFPEQQLLHGDFFDFKGTFDLIIEQTFFCAINPEKRSLYAEKMHELLSNEGKLVGLFFDAKLNDDHPPFGGTKEEYITYFEPFFDIQIMDSCYNSYPNRQGMELFIKLQKKKTI